MKRHELYFQYMNIIFSLSIIFLQYQCGFVPKMHFWVLFYVWPRFWPWPWPSIIQKAITFWFLTFKNRKNVNFVWIYYNDSKNFIKNPDHRNANLTAAILDFGGTPWPVAWGLACKISGRPHTITIQSGSILELIVQFDENTSKKTLTN